MSESCNSRISRSAKNPPADQTYTEAGTSWALAGEVVVGPSVVMAGVLLAAEAGVFLAAAAGVLLAAVVKVLLAAGGMVSMVVLIVLVCDDKAIIVDNCLICVCLSFSNITCYQLKKKKGAMM
jgi:uncharacterized membrane protein YqjE